MIEPIFEGARSRCKKHSFNLLGPDQVECGDCELNRRNLSFQPPFDVKCNRSFMGVNKDNIYTVLWVIKEASKQYSDHISGYVFKDVKGGINPNIYDATDFTPVVFLKDEKETPAENKEPDDMDGIYGWG